jgi:hypothetical protein
MLAKPNKTVIEGTVRAIAPANEGQGHEIEIEVHRNLSRGRSDDFIQPTRGQSLHLFATQAPDVAIAIEFVCKRDCWLGRSASGQFSNNSIPYPTKPDRELDLCPQGHDTSAHCDICKRNA